MCVVLLRSLYRKILVLQNCIVLWDFRASVCVYVLNAFVDFAWKVDEVNEVARIETGRKRGRCKKRGREMLLKNYARYVGFFIRTPQPKGKNKQKFLFIQRVYMRHVRKFVIVQKSNGKAQTVFKFKCVFEYCLLNEFKTTQKYSALKRVYCVVYVVMLSIVHFISLAFFGDTNKTTTTTTNSIKKQKKPTEMKNQIFHASLHLNHCTCVHTVYTFIWRKYSMSKIWAYNRKHHNYGRQILCHQKQ